MPLAGLKMEDLAGTRVERLVARLDPHRSADDHDDARLAHLVIAERVAGIELDQDDALGAVA